MKAVTAALQQNYYFNQTNVPFLVLGSFDVLEKGFTGPLTQLLAQRSREKRNVIIGLLDRSNYRTGNNRQVTWLFGSAIVMPHVAGHENGEIARDCCGHGQCQLPAKRSGFVFMGDTRRYDGGARGAARDIMRHLPVNTTFQSSLWMRVDEAELLPRFDERGTLVANPSYIERWVAAMRESAEAMRTGRLCWAPRGDVETTRRIFDAVAVGCVPM